MPDHKMIIGTDAESSGQIRPTLETEFLQVYTQPNGYFAIVTDQAGVLHVHVHRDAVVQVHRVGPPPPHKAGVDDEHGVFIVTI